MSSSASSDPDSSSLPASSSSEEVSSSSDSISSSLGSDSSSLDSTGVGSSAYSSSGVGSSASNSDSAARDTSVGVHPSEYDQSSWLSKLTFWWVGKLIARGSKDPLENKDLEELAEDDRPQYLNERLSKHWQEQDKDVTEKSLWSTLNFVYGTRTKWVGMIWFAESFLRLGQPMLLVLLLETLEDKSKPSSDAYPYAVGIFLCTFFQAFLHHAYFFSTMRNGWRARSGVMTMVYQKLLTLSKSELQKSNTGEIVNLVSNDVQRFDDAAPFVHFLWLAPFELIGTGILVGRLLGFWPTLAGLGTFAVSIPLQTIFGKLFGKRRRITAKYTDQRTLITNEILVGISAVKMYAWEMAFGKKIGDLRRKERQSIRKSGYLRAFNLAMFFTTQILVSFVTYTVYQQQGNTLTASRVYASLALIRVLRLTMGMFLPRAVETVSELRVSVERLQKFLRLENTTHSAQKSEKDLKKSPLAKISGGSFAWGDGPEVLHDISITAKPGLVTAIVGPVGSGKSSLLNAFLGEMRQTTGSTKLQGSVAYCDQQPWILAGSVRENILFGQEYDEDRYHEVLTACSLWEDIDSLPNGDKTEIGERGVNLSGGQKARISLARASYQDAAVYLLDDPLSAVDPKVGRVLFHDCIQGLLSDKVVLLVTHQLQYLQEADNIVLLEDGEVEAQGSYDELSNSDIDFAELLADYHDDDQADGGEGGSTGPAKEGNSGGQSGKLMTAEDREVGKINLSVYGTYIKYTGVIAFIIWAIMMLVGQGAVIATDYWLFLWIEKSPAEQSDDYYLYMYAIIGGSAVVVAIVRAMFFFHIALGASTRLYNDMFRRVLAAPMHFFQSNPTGRILNRFSKDQGLIDELLPFTFFDFCQTALMVIATLVVVGLGLPWVLVSVIPFLAWFVWLRNRYLASAREIKRLEAVTRSPIYAHFGATLRGLSTLRAFKATDRFHEQFMKKIEVNGHAFFMFLATSRWLGFRLDMIVASVLLVVTMVAIWMRDTVESGLIGLAIVYAMQLTGLFQWTVRQSAELENLMTSVERAKRYTKIEQEAPAEIPETAPPQSWPKKGEITFKKLEMKYPQQKKAVLRGITVRFKPEEKIGIVGRTGAGKSSLIASLFRLVEASSGTIAIDGVDTKTIGLRDLRSKISVIPQEPVLFSGSVRYNLDPFDQYADKDLWRALEVVQLKKFVGKMNHGIETSIAEAGENFSVGQRQLLCLARALLRKNRVLVLDEATASVDLETDAIIQSTIREAFANCTVLTIAHRMATIMDMDKILVLDKGRVAEFDSPVNLLQDSDGLFYSMIEDTGASSAAKLHDLAISGSWKIGDSTTSDSDDSSS